MGGPRTVLFHGHLVDPRTAEMLTEVEAITSDTLHVWQGSYSNGAKSGGTHTGGGAVDVSPTKGSWDALVAATRQHLAAASAVSTPPTAPAGPAASGG